MLTALILGLMTAISPCPLATNISAIGFISRDIEDNTRVFKSGLIYTLGRAFSYVSLAIILYFGADQFNITMLFQGWGEKILGPLLIIIGLFMLGILKLNIPGLSRYGEKLGEKAKKSYWGSFFLGALFALAFCPYSGVLYFGMLIPMSIASTSGLLLPLVFAVATGLPVVLFAWMLAYAMHNVSKTHNRIRSFERYFRRLIAILFIGVGLYYIILFFT
jgi:cytochrome c biogenesis protein CcdA